MKVAVALAAAWTMASCASGQPPPADLSAASEAGLTPIDRSDYDFGIVESAEFSRTTGGRITGTIQLDDGTRLTIRDANDMDVQCDGGGDNFELADGTYVTNPTGCLAIALFDPANGGQTLELLAPSPEPSPPRWGLIGEPLAIGAETLVMNTSVLDEAVLRLEEDSPALRREVLDYEGNCPEGYSLDAMVILVDEDFTARDWAGYAVSPFHDMGSKCGYVR